MGGGLLICQNRVQIGCSWVQLLKFYRSDQFVNHLGGLFLHA
jgi:hypothetical protein